MGRREEQAEEKREIEKNLGEVLCTLSFILKTTLGMGGILEFLDSSGNLRAQKKCIFQPQRTFWSR